MLGSRPPGSRSAKAGSAPPPHEEAQLTARAVWDSLPELCRACQPLAEAEAGAGRLVDAVFMAAPVGLALLDQDLRCVRINPRAAEFLGIGVADALGRTADELWSAIDPRMLDRLRATIATGEAAPEMEFTVMAQGAERPGRAFAIAHGPIGDAFGGVAGVVVSVNEVTDRVRAQEERRRAREALEAVFRASPLAVNAVDAEGRVTHWNRAAERLFGWRADEVVGRPLPIIADRAPDDPEHAAGSPANGRIVERIGSDGNARHVALWTAPILEDGRIQGSVDVLEDVGPRLDAQRMSDALNALAAALASALGTRDVAAAALSTVLGAIDADRAEISLVRAGGVEGLLALAADGSVVALSPWRSILPDGPVAILLRDDVPFWFESAAELAERFPKLAGSTGLETPNPPAATSSAETPTQPAASSSAAARTPSTAAAPQTPPVAAAPRTPPVAADAPAASSSASAPTPPVAADAPAASSSAGAPTGPETPPPLETPAPPAAIARSSGALGLLPLNVQEGVVGVMSVERDDPRPFTVAERDFARTASHLVAQALARARLFEAERSGRHRLERVYEVTAALGGASTRADVANVLQSRILAALGADAFAIALASPDGLTLRVEQLAGYSAEAGEVGRLVPVSAHVPSTDAYREATPILLPSAEAAARRYPDVVTGLRNAGMASHGALPLVAGSGAIGSLIVDWRTPRALDPPEVRYLEAVAAACAQAFVRVALYERAVRDEATLEEVVRQMPVGVILADASGGRILIESDRNETIWRGRPATQGGVADLAAWRGRGPDGRPYEADEWPIARSLQAGEIVVGEEIEIERLDDTRGFISVSAAPVRDADGNMLAAVEVRTDITERVEAAAMRDTFMGVLSHELRTPTTLVMGIAELLASHWEDMPDEERRSLIEDVRAEASGLNRMIDNLLVLASAERGALPVFEPEPVLLQRLVVPIIRAEEARWPGARFSVELSPELPAVQANSSAVEQVLRNLLGNAAKYAGGMAHVTADLHDGSLDLVVADRGPGIEPAESDAIFRPFYRSLRTARSSAGSGIGLFVCRHLVEAMGGTLRFEDNPGGGSRFVATFRSIGD